MRLFFIFFTILFSNFIIGQSNFFTDIGLFSGVNFNGSTRPELFQTTVINGEEHFFHGSNMNRQKHFFIDFNTNVCRQQLRRKSEKNSFTLNFRSGLFYTQTQRKMNISYYVIHRQDISETVINNFDNLFYLANSHNIGLSNAVLFQKKWTKYFALEYGITHRIDYVVSKDIDYKKEPENNAWRNATNSKRERFKTNFNQDILLNLSTQFFLTKKMSIGLQADITTLIFQRWYAVQSNIILGEMNNRLNSNMYLGLTVRYDLK